MPGNLPFSNEKGLLGFYDSILRQKGAVAIEEAVYE